MGFTSSRRDDRTNAYTERILSVEGNIFSSCVRSENLTRIVVCEQSVIVIVDDEDTHSESSISLGFLRCLALRSQL